MRTFEYTAVKVDSLDGDGALQELNQLGAEGWEAFAAFPVALDGYAYAISEGARVLLRRSCLP